MPKPKAVECRHDGCHTMLTEPYAIEMGECVSCCLHRMRGTQGKGFMVHYTSRQRRERERAYAQRRRAKAQATA